VQATCLFEQAKEMTPYENAALVAVRIESKIR
jgi:hypothetical protein